MKNGEVKPGTEIMEVHLWEAELYPISASLNFSQFGLPTVLEARLCGIWRATCPRHIGVDVLTRATTCIGSETAISPAAEVRWGAYLPGFFATSADDPSTRRPFKNRRQPLRLQFVPHRSGSRPDRLFAGPALLSGAIAGRIRPTRR